LSSMRREIVKGENSKQTGGVQKSTNRRNPRNTCGNQAGGEPSQNTGWLAAREKRVLCGGERKWCNRRSLVG
jgi:hypothetical protein